MIDSKSKLVYIYLKHQEEEKVNHERGGRGGEDGGSRREGGKGREERGGREAAQPQPEERESGQEERICRVETLLLCRHSFSSTSELILYKIVLLIRSPVEQVMIM